MVEGVVVQKLEGTVLTGVSQGAVGDRGLRAVAHHGVGHPEGREDVVREELSERLSGNSLHHQRQHLVPGVRVLVALTGGEQGGLVPGGQEPHRLFGVGHALDRLLFEDVVVVRNPRGVGEEVAEGDTVSEACELGQESDQRIVERELTAVGEDHDRHRGDLLRHRSQAERRVRGDGFPALEIGKTVSRGVEDLVVLHHQDRRPGGVAGRQGGEERVDPGREVLTPGGREVAAASCEGETDDDCENKPDAQLRIHAHTIPPGKAHHRHVGTRG